MSRHDPQTYYYSMIFCTLFTGINQLQWALEFLRCMKVDYGYPESIEKIVGELEEQLISLYAKVGEKIQENKRKKDLEEMEKDVNEKNEKSKHIGLRKFARNQNCYYTYIISNFRQAIFYCIFVFITERNDI